MANDAGRGLWTVEDRTFYTLNIFLENALQEKEMGVVVGKQYLNKKEIANIMVGKTDRYQYGQMIK